MSKQHMNLQDSYLNQVRRENAEVQVLLVTGTTLSGFVKGFDNFTLVLNERNGHQHLVYKHAIAHMTSKRPVSGRQQHDQKPQAQEPAGEQAAPDRGTQKDRKKKGAGFNPIDLSGLKLAEGAEDTEKVATNK